MSQITSLVYLHGKVTPILRKVNYHHQGQKHNAVDSNSSTITMWKVQIDI